MTLITFGGSIIWVAVTEERTSGTAMLVLVVIGIILILSGIACALFISPDWKKPKDIGFDAYGQPFVAPISPQVVCNKPKCKDCGTELRYNDDTLLYDCYYCHISLAQHEI
jgi:hypothetical protein